MPQVPFPHITESLEELEALAKSQSNTRMYQRVQMLVWIQSERVQTRRQIAQWLGVHHNSITIWLNTYQNQGLQALLTEDKRGPTTQRILTEKAFQALAHKISTPQGFASFGEVQQWLKQTFELDVAYKSLWSLIKKEFGGKLKTPRPSHPKKTALK